MSAFHQIDGGTAPSALQKKNRIEMKRNESKQTNRMRSREKREREKIDR